MISNALTAEKHCDFRVCLAFDYFLMFWLFFYLQIMFAPDSNTSNIFIWYLEIFWDKIILVVILIRQNIPGWNGLGAFIGVGLHPLAVVHFFPPYTLYIFNMQYPVFSLHLTVEKKIVLLKKKKVWGQSNH